MRKLGWVALIAGIAGGISAIRSKVGSPVSGGVSNRPPDRRSEPDPQALEALSSGEVERVALNVEQLKQMNPEAYEPLVEYLTYIQIQRGENQSLVFVRQRDLDELAEMVGEPRDEFVEKFEQLGVLLSMN